MGSLQEFHTKQDEWAGVYRDEVGVVHREKAALLEVAGETRALRVLELGCGGGQVAYAIADRGHWVVAIDLNSRAIEQARRLAAARSDDRMTVILGGFCEVALDGQFDVVSLFDGFGVGEDEDQRRLLLRISDWLAPGGRVLIEVYAPWYWAKVAVTQSLRCYAPDELYRLLEPTGLKAVHIRSGGAYDHNTGIYREQAPLGEAMQYIAALEQI